MLCVFKKKFLASSSNWLWLRSLLHVWKQLHTSLFSKNLSELQHTVREKVLLSVAVTETSERSVSSFLPPQNAVRYHMTMISNCWNPLHLQMCNKPAALNLLEESPSPLVVLQRKGQKKSLWLSSAFCSCLKTEFDVHLYLWISPLAV